MRYWCGAAFLLCAACGSSSGSADEPLGGLAATVKLIDDTPVAGCVARVRGTAWQGSCDEQGNLSITGILTGSWELEVSAMGDAFAELAPRRVAIGVNENEVTQLDIVLYRGGAAHGHVVPAMSGGTPSLEALITAADTFASSNSTGLYFMERIPPGSHRFMAFVDSGVIVRESVPITAGNVAAPVDFLYDNWQFGPGSVSGDVIVPAGYTDVTVRAIETRTNGQAFSAPVADRESFGFSADPGAYLVEAQGTLALAGASVPIRIGTLAFILPTETTEVHLVLPAARDLEDRDLNDLDGDGIANDDDLDPLDARPGRSHDSDGDGLADEFDMGSVRPTADDDGDGFADGFDTCPDLPQEIQSDTDSDRVGDACDNCPSVANASQLDANENGVGDACEGAGCATSCDCGEGQVCVDSTCTPDVFPMASGGVRTLVPTRFVAATAQGSGDGSSPANASGSLETLAGVAPAGAVIATLSSVSGVHDVDLETDDLTVSGGWIACSATTWRRDPNAYTTLDGIDELSPPLTVTNSSDVLVVGFASPPCRRLLAATGGDGLTLAALRLTDYSACMTPVFADGTAGLVQLNNSDGVRLSDLTLADDGVSPNGSAVSLDVVRMQNSSGLIQNVTIPARPDFSASKANGVTAVYCNLPSGPVTISDVTYEDEDNTRDPAVVVTNATIGTITIQNSEFMAGRNTGILLNSVNAYAISGITTTPTALGANDQHGMQIIASAGTIENVLLETSTASPSFGISIDGPSGPTTLVNVDIQASGAGGTFTGIDVRSAVPEVTVSGGSIETTGTLTNAIGFYFGNSENGALSVTDFAVTLGETSSSNYPLQCHASADMNLERVSLIAGEGIATGVNLWHCKSLAARNSFFFGGFGTSSAAIGGDLSDALTLEACTLEGGGQSDGNRSAGVDLTAGSVEVTILDSIIGAGIAPDFAMVRLTPPDIPYVSENSYYWHRASGSPTGDFAPTVMDEANPGVADAEGDIYGASQRCTTSFLSVTLDPLGPCVDAAGTTHGPTDIQGQPRASGTAPDIGADELQQ